MLNFCDFIQVFVFTTSHHLKVGIIRILCLSEFDDIYRALEVKCILSKDIFP